jgi:polyisoprenoid-binding protein YceI
MPSTLTSAMVGVALLIAAGPSVLAAQAVTPGRLRHAEVTFAIKATKVADFVGRVDSVRAEFSGTSLANVTGSLEIQLGDMRTGVGLRDTHMRRTMRADSFPTIRFALAGVDVGASNGDSVAVVLRGDLTMHGVTRAVRVPGHVIVRGGEVDVAASFPIDMREYGIVPPARFFGAVKVDPIVGIAVRLGFGG